MALDLERHVQRIENIFFTRDAVCQHLAEILKLLLESRARVRQQQPVLALIFNDNALARGCPR
jgi:hypothetical protein